jgi:uncharacterized protein YdhG (YjbR/CyaY superfamily)
MAVPPPPNVDAYIAAAAEADRPGLEAIRRTIRAAAPDTDEVIAYAMPAHRSRDGRFLVSYANFKRHYSLFPASEAITTTLGAEIQPHLAGKGTIQFQKRDPLPLDLIRRIVEIRLIEHSKDR